MSRRRLLGWLLGGALVASGPVAAARPVRAHQAHAKTSHAHHRHGHARAHRPVFSGHLVSIDQLRTQPLDKPTGHLELYAVNFHESLDVDLYRPDGSFDPNAIDELNHFWRCKRTDTEKAIDPRLYETLSRIYDHFGKRIELVSGFRNQERTSSYHFNGSASDIRIPGVPLETLRGYVASLDTGGMGLGIYPRAGFIHVDVRPEASYRWVDYSPPGTSNMGHPHRRHHHRHRQTNT